MPTTQETTMVEEKEKPDSEKRFAIICGLTLAVFAAVLAITDLGGGKYGDDEMIAANERASALAWYQSKSVKESLVEGQRDLVKTLVQTGAIKSEQVAAMELHVADLEKEIARYEKEKNEILLGSAAVGEENWAQDVDGELGKITGAKEWEGKLKHLGAAGDVYDLSVLFLQVCLVLGAIALVLHLSGMKKIFYALMVLTGGIGIYYSIQAFRIAGLAG